MPSEECEATKLLVDSKNVGCDEGSIGAAAALRPNLICLQIYMVTEDYSLKLKDNVGLSMYANRELQQDEVVIRSPTGPETNKKLLGASHEGEKIGSERQAFMDRFMVWQEKNPEVAVGASDAPRPKFKETDFFYQGQITYQLATPSNRSYFFQLKKMDFLLVEFVPNPHTITITLPEHRWFEVLPHGEGIFDCAEDDYSPPTHRCPPTLDRDFRELEIPTHFTNHDCGSFATTYDTYRLPREGEGGGCPLVAPAQPEIVRAQLEEYTRTRVFPPSGTPFGDLKNQMTTFRPTQRGKELTTDYALWHWSNEDYVEEVTTDYHDREWDALPAAVHDAAVVLGYTKDMWSSEGEPPCEDEWWSDLSPEEQAAAETLGYSQSAWNHSVEPWFHCLCGNPECHSADGFLGMESFSLEEQRRLYWVCSPWIQNQIDWKIYQMKSCEKSLVSNKT